MTEPELPAHLSRNAAVRVVALKIREAIKRGPDDTTVSGADRVMIAFATCDRQRWIPESSATTPELWAGLHDLQRDAVSLYLSGVKLDTKCS